MAKYNNPMKAFTARGKSGDSCLVIAKSMNDAIAAFKKKTGGQQCSSISVMEDWQPNGKSTAMPVVIAEDDSIDME